MRTRTEIKSLILAFATTYKEDDPDNAKKLSKIVSRIFDGIPTEQQVLTAEKLLIAEQALKISNLEKQVQRMNDSQKEIRGLITCIGGPMNDNIDQYNHKQLGIFARILQIME